MSFWKRLETFGEGTSFWKRLGRVLRVISCPVLVYVKTFVEKSWSELGKGFVWTLMGVIVT